MTNQALGPIPFAPPPPRFYWTLHLETAAERSRARDRGETRAVDEFITEVNKAADLTARKNPDPKVRAEGYRNKPASLWAEQFLYFVEDCAEDWLDWEKIAPADEHLREEVVYQIEVLLHNAGIDLQDPNIHSASAKMERFLADAQQPNDSTPTQPVAALPAPRDRGGTSPGPTPNGPAYP